MENQVAALGEQFQMAAEGLSHAALNAVAFMGFAQNIAGGEPDARR